MNTIDITVAEINKLSLSEKILIVEEIWDNIFKENEYAQLTKAQEIELNHRIDSYHANPQQGRTWDEIKSQFWQER
jgi:putative addiction module component (TIGR02574 family)